MLEERRKAAIKEYGVLRLQQWKNATPEWQAYTAKRQEYNARAKALQDRADELTEALRGSRQVQEQARSQNPKPENRKRKHRRQRQASPESRSAGRRRAPAPQTPPASPGNRNPPAGCYAANSVPVPCPGRGDLPQRRKSRRRKGTGRNAGSSVCPKENGGKPGPLPRKIRTPRFRYTKKMQNFRFFFFFSSRKKEICRYDKRNPVYSAAVPLGNSWICRRPGKQGCFLIFFHGGIL